MHSTPSYCRHFSALSAISVVLKRFILLKNVTVQPALLFVTPAFSGDQKGADGMPESRTRLVPREMKFFINRNDKALFLCDLASLREKFMN